MPNGFKVDFKEREAHLFGGGGHDPARRNSNCSVRRPRRTYPYGSDGRRRSSACGDAGRYIGILFILVAGLCATGCSDAVWRPDLGGAMRLAAERNQVVVVQYYSPFNGDCWRMADEVFTDEEVKKALRGVIPVRINALWDRSFEREFGLAIIPSFIAIAPDGAELRRTSGFMDADRFRAFVDISRLSN